MKNMEDVMNVNWDILENIVTRHVPRIAKVDVTEIVDPALNALWDTMVKHALRPVLLIVPIKFAIRTVDCVQIVVWDGMDQNAIVLVCVGQTNVM